MTFDGLRYTSFFDVTSNAWKLLSVEMLDDYGDYNEIRDSSGYSCATSDTLLNGAYDFDFWCEELQCADDCFFPEDLHFLRAARQEMQEVW